MYLILRSLMVCCYLSSPLCAIISSSIENPSTPFTLPYAPPIPTFKDKLKQGEVGDFIVSEQNKNVSLLRIHSFTTNTLILEEITIPSHLTRSLSKDWSVWLREGAPGHTSWMLIEIDLNETKITECYSFSRQAWLMIDAKDSFFLKLINLNLEKTPLEKQRRIGPPPSEGPDFRKIWLPPLIVDGKELMIKNFTPLYLIWPSDDSPLSGKRIDLYFRSDDPSFPFPHWAQISDASNASFKIRILDSGKKLDSPKKELPRRRLS